MITPEQALAAKDDPAPLASQLTPEDVAWLVERLTEKDDALRYASFLTLQARSSQSNDVYAHWDTLAAKLGNENSYQRSLGVMLMAENIRWDAADRFSQIADAYLKCCDDEKFITARQTLQSLAKIVPHRPALAALVTDTLLALDLAPRKDTQRKLLLMDILSVLAAIQKISPDDRIAAYIQQAFTGGLLDRKAIKEIEKLL